MIFVIVTQAEAISSGPRRMTHRVVAVDQPAAVGLACERHRYAVTPCSAPGIRIISVDVDTETAA